MITKSPSYMSFLFHFIAFSPLFHDTAEL